MDIYVRRNGEQLGPLSENQVRTRIEVGVISPSDLAWTVGKASWQPLSSLIDLEVAEPPPISEMPKADDLDEINLVLNSLPHPSASADDESALVESSNLTNADLSTKSSSIRYRGQPNQGSQLVEFVPRSHGSNMRIFGSFAFITGVLALLLVLFITGPALNEAKQQLEKRDVFGSFRAEFSGKAAEERQTINSLATINKVAVTSGVILLVVGAGAWLAGSGE